MRNIKIVLLILGLVIQNLAFAGDCKDLLVIFKNNTAANFPTASVPHEVVFSPALGAPGVSIGYITPGEDIDSGKLELASMNNFFITVYYNLCRPTQFISKDVSGNYKIDVAYERENNATQGKLTITINK